MKYLYDPVIAECPVCNSNDSKLLYTVNAEQCARHFKVTYEIDNSKFEDLVNHIKKRWKKDEASIIQCMTCDFVYAIPFVSGDYELYNMFGSDASLDPGPWKWEFECTRDSIKQLTSTPKNYRLLEIGAGFGGFIRNIADIIIPANNIVCLEYSEIAVNELKKKGVKASSMDVRSADFQTSISGKFDFICLFQVLEHLDKYEDLFSSFDKITADNSKIYIAVPNGKRIEFNEKNKGLLDLPPNHIGRFNRQSLEALVKKFGWKINEFRLEEQSYSEIMGGIMYYRALQRIIKKSDTGWLNTVLDYIDINIMKLKIMSQRRAIGDNIWICITKANN